MSLVRRMQQRTLPMTFPDQMTLLSGSMALTDKMTFLARQLMTLPDLQPEKIAEHVASDGAGFVVQLKKVLYIFFIIVSWSDNNNLGYAFMNVIIDKFHATLTVLQGSIICI
eukprot:gene27263-2517_t